MSDQARIILLSFLGVCDLAFFTFGVIAFVRFYRHAVNVRDRMRMLIEAGTVPPMRVSGIGMSRFLAGQGNRDAHPNVAAEYDEAKAALLRFLICGGVSMACGISIFLVNQNR